jgi:hypothetical protein
MATFGHRSRFRRTNVGAKHLAEAQVDIPGLFSKCFARTPRINTMQQISTLESATMTWHRRCGIYFLTFIMSQFARIAASLRVPRYKWIGSVVLLY